MSTEEFVTARKSLREELGRHEAELMARLKTLDDVLWERPFTAEEKKQRQAVVDELAELHREQFFLIEADIREFDKQERIAELKAHFEGLTKELKRRQAKLEELIGAVQTGTKVIQAVEKVAQQLAKLLI